MPASAAFANDINLEDTIRELLDHENGLNRSRAVGQETAQPISGPKLSNAQQSLQAIAERRPHLSDESKALIATSLKSEKEHYEKNRVNKDINIVFEQSRHEQRLEEIRQISKGMNKADKKQAERQEQVTKALESGDDEALARLYADKSKPVANDEARKRSSLGSRFSRASAVGSMLKDGWDAVPGKAADMGRALYDMGVPNILIFKILEYTYKGAKWGVEKMMEGGEFVADTYREKKAERDAELAEFNELKKELNFEEQADGSYRVKPAVEGVEKSKEFKRAYVDAVTELKASCEKDVAKETEGQSKTFSDAITKAEDALDGDRDDPGKQTALVDAIKNQQTFLQERSERVRELVKNRLKGKDAENLEKNLHSILARQLRDRGFVTNGAPNGIATKDQTEHQDLRERQGLERENISTPALR